MSARDAIAGMPAPQQHAQAEPPWSSQAEQSVLGAVLIDNAAYERCADVIVEGDFYHAAHRAIWRTLAATINAHQPADIITVYEAGGHDIAYLNELACSVVSAANVHRYAAIVRARSIERQLVHQAGVVVAIAHDPAAEIEDKVDRVQALFARMGEIKSRRDPMGIDDAASALLDYVQAMASGKNPAIATGIASLDRITAGGIRRGELWVIGARPKMGKTAFTLALLRNMSAQHGTLFLSQEMPVLQLTMRHAAALGSINMNALRMPKPDDDRMWSALVDGIDHLRRLNMVQDSQGGLTLHDVRRKLLAARRQHAIDVVVVDYLQLMAGEGENRNAELDRISNGLKAMAMEHDIGVILLSQLNRKADDRSGPPVMGDLRDSGAIEAAADLIGMLYRDAVRNETEDNRQHAQLEIVAQRNGPNGTVHLRFVGEYQQFADWGHEPLPRRGSPKVQRDRHLE